MKLEELFNAMLNTWKVRLECPSNGLNFTAYSNEPIFEPYLHREVEYIHRGLTFVSGTPYYEIGVVIKEEDEK